MAFCIFTIARFGYSRPTSQSAGPAKSGGPVIGDVMPSESAFRPVCGAWCIHHDHQGRTSTCIDRALRPRQAHSSVRALNATAARCMHGLCAVPRELGPAPPPLGAAAGLTRHWRRGPTAYHLGQSYSPFVRAVAPASIPTLGRCLMPAPIRPARCVVPLSRSSPGSPRGR